MEGVEPKKLHRMLLLYEHCTTPDEPDCARPSAAERLELMLGTELTRFLLGALVGSGGVSSRLRF